MELATPESAVSLASVVRNLTNCATGLVMKQNYYDAASRCKIDKPLVVYLLSNFKP